METNAIERVKKLLEKAHTEKTTFHILKKQHFHLLTSTMKGGC